MTPWVEGMRMGQKFDADCGLGGSPEEIHLPRSHDWLGIGDEAYAKPREDLPKTGPRYGSYG
ncbi:uncharacterized protein HMPREF1541_00034 [Cyphellophora europaea CBS 101466]|uniref:Uncharacterized protein n=1 Tax=Cyphellophora europaea (strain CBS 101466) TaxID=1220924 RepID=W2SCV4_CYPE1|nr:uncharacterized protein HMPREF1541_00034 [Cyphellophora europaea CBS 101466]ETN45853.1 hypothetical protein HMPREF1541_00034 [Cyphellophora europaea CBS 101466]